MILPVDGKRHCPKRALLHELEPDSSEPSGCFAQAVTSVESIRGNHCLGRRMEEEKLVHVQRGATKMLHFQIWGEAHSVLDGKGTTETDWTDVKVEDRISMDGFKL